MRITKKIHQNPILSPVILGTLISANLSAVVVSGPVNLATSASTAASLLQQPGYAATGWVEIHEGASSYRGTGVLIGTNWVLTAAHNWDTGAVTSLSFHLQGDTYAAVSGSWVQHPGWLANSSVGHTQGWDLALFQLSSAVTAVAPANVYRGSNELGATATFLGAGLTGSGGSILQPNTAATIMAGTNTIDRAITTPGSSTGGLLAFDFDDGNALRNTLSGNVIYDTQGRVLTEQPDVTVLTESSGTEPTFLEATSALGDSGGPVFADFGNGPELVGLVSWGVNPSNTSNPYGSGLGDVTYLTRLSPHADWIAATVPEPSTWALLGLGFALTLLTTRTRK